jgi:hypothetical protein
MTKLHALFLLPAVMLCLWPASAQSVPSGQTVNATGTWLATDVPYAPWTVQLKQDGAKLTGTMEQNGGLRGQVEIYAGKVDGPAISFKAKSPDGARAITFTGTVKGDDMVLNRSTEILTDGSPGGTGLFGTNAAPQFTIHRAAVSAPAGGGQHWVASEGVAFPPWTFDLKIEGGTVTGSVGQARQDSASQFATSATGPFEISDGKLSGNTIDFKVVAPGGGKIITFHGLRTSDQIAFTRSVEMKGGDPGRDGILGVDGAKQFTAKLGAAGGIPAPVRTGPISARAISQTGPSGRWIVANIANGPWIFTLSASSTALGGFVNQQGSNITVSIAGGKATDTSVSFTVLSPDAERLVVFNGRVNGDEISFVRTITPLPGGSRGGNDLYGASAPLQFVAKRAAGLAMTPVSTAPAGPPKKIEYKGIEIDVTSIQSLANYGAAIDSLHRQLDIVEAAVPDPAQIAFLTSIPMVFAPSVSSGSDNAAYGNGRVVLTTLMFSPEKPVILHELMHAYHDRKVPNGFGNAEILKLLEQARLGGQFPVGSYMLTNPAEYFAMVSSVYLHGTAARDPFTRQAIKEKQPDCYQWMVKEFGPR